MEKKVKAKSTSPVYDDMANLFLKDKPLRDPESYDRSVYVINKMLGGEDDLTLYMAEFSKYLWTLRGRYYLLLWSFIPKTNKKLWFKNAKRFTLEAKERNRVQALQGLLNYSGRDAYYAKLILEKEGFDLDKIFGVQPDAV